MINTTSKFLRSILNRFGYEISKGDYLELKAFEWHLRNLFTSLNIDCVLDVGANTGGYRNFLRNRVGFEGTIISFEPVKKNVEQLINLAKTDSNWIIYDFALGSEDTENEINIMKSDQMCSFLSPNSAIINELRENNTIMDKELVSIRKLDSIMPILKEQHKLHNIYLKIDTQGFDLEVIKGAEKTLPLVCALQTEVSIIPIYENMPPFFEIHKFLAERNFDITGLFPVSRDSHQRVIEFDCVMLNKLN
jgi:FkbM family methyltransferase